MRVQLLLFASYADALGPGPIALELTDGARSGAPMIAVNQRWADASRPLADGDEVALLPPVAGG